MESAIQFPSLRTRFCAGSSFCSDSAREALDFMRAPKSSLPIRVSRINSGMQLIAMTVRWLSRCRLDLNDPPASSGGIPESSDCIDGFRLDLNDPPASSGGISESSEGGRSVEIIL